MGNRSRGRERQKRLNLAKIKKLRKIAIFENEKHSPEEIKKSLHELEVVEKIILERQKTDPNYRPRTPSPPRREVHEVHEKVKEINIQELIDQHLNKSVSWLLNESNSHTTWWTKPK